MNVLMTKIKARITVAITYVTYMTRIPYVTHIRHTHMHAYMQSNPSTYIAYDTYTHAYTHYVNAHACIT